MATDREHLDLILRDLARSEERSPLFFWLLEHHDEIVRAQEGKRIRWGKMAVRFEQVGLTDVTGKPPTPRTARETWYQVRRVIAARQAGSSVSRPVKVMPSKVSSDARPVVAPDPALVSAAAAQAAVPIAGDWPTPNVPPQQQPEPGAASNRKPTGAEMTERLRERLRTRNY